MSPETAPHLSAGDRNLAVRAAKGAVQRDLVAHNITPRSNGVGTYGSAFVRDVEAWKRLHNLRGPDGSFRGGLWGSRAWGVAWPLLTGQERAWVAKAASQLAEARAASEAGRARRALVDSANRFLAHRFEFTYAQIRPFPIGLLDPANRRRFDCSSTVINLYALSGLPDPSGFGYQGWGDTGALWRHGVRVRDAQPGDLGFYGWEQNARFPSGRPGHVVMYLGDGRVVSFGSTPPWSPAWNYRSDFIGWRSYLQ